MLVAVARAIVVSPQDAHRLVGYIYSDHPHADVRFGPASLEVRTDLPAAALIAACQAAGLATFAVVPWDRAAASRLEVGRALARYRALLKRPRGADVWMAIQCRLRSARQDAARDRVIALGDPLWLDLRTAEVDADRRRRAARGED